MADDLRSRESVRRKALWTLSHLMPGDPKAAVILDVLDDFKTRKASTQTGVIQASISMLSAKQF